MAFTADASVVWWLIGVIVTLVGWIFIDSRSHLRAQVADHEDRLREVEAVKADVKYIRESVDELRGKVHVNH